MIQGFGITFLPLQKEDIELVRSWRNSEHIRKFALSQTIISSEQQVQWFEKVSLSKDEYFIIEHDDKKCGLIWYNHAEEKLETGFYLYDTSLQNSLFPFKVITLFHDYLFHTCEYISLSCKILKENTKAIRFNEALGFKRTSECDVWDGYTLNIDDYMIHDKKIRKLLNTQKEKQ